VLGDELRPEDEEESAELVALRFAETGERLVFSVALCLRGAFELLFTSSGRNSTRREKREIKPKLFAVGCDRLPRRRHGKGAPKDGRGSPPWLRKQRQVLRTRRPTRDAATLTASVKLVNHAACL
jgi:hypothetical protein